MINVLSFMVQYSFIYMFTLISYLGLREVRSKILTPLETTGGNSFSLEGFEKMLFTI